MVKNSIFKTSKDTILADPEQYRRIIGCLLYLGFTRLDLTYATQQLSQFVSEPHQCHMDAAMHILKYLKENPAIGLFYLTYTTQSSSSFSLEAYYNANWAACKDTRRSITGYCVFLVLVSWKTKKQVTVSRSSAEVEY